MMNNELTEFCNGVVIDLIPENNDVDIESIECTIESKEIEITKAMLSLGHEDNLFNRLTLDAPADDRINSLANDILFKNDILSRDSKVSLPIELLHRTYGKRGRPVGKKLTHTEKLLIGYSANVDSVSAAARAFGVSRETADGYKDGSYQQGVKNPKSDPKLISALDTILGKAKNLASSKMLKSLESIDDESIIKLGKEKPLLSAELAVKMSTVVEKLTPKDNRNEGNKVQVVVYGPEERGEDKYDRIDVALNLEDR